MTVTSRLLDAIREYTEEYGHDEKHQDAVRELKATASALEPAKEEDTPGKEQTRRAIAHAREKPEEPKDKPVKGDAPRSFKDARERAMKRFSEDPDGSDGEGEGTEATSAAAAA